jgi:hypothetical protein
MTIMLWGGVVLATGMGFYWDIIAGERQKAAYHIAWAAVFLACLALSQGG